MDRRNFLNRVTAGVAGATTALALTKTGLSLGPKTANENRNVSYGVSGFTCVTCAVGLEVMLRQQKGVTRASASYPAARVVIGFDQNLTSDESLRQFIASCGFFVT